MSFEILAFREWTEISAYDFRELNCLNFPIKLINAISNEITANQTQFTTIVFLLAKHNKIGIFF